MAGYDMNNKEKILVVDDEKSMQEFLKITLGREGYQVVTASTGAKALKIFEKDLFDMVISDIKMPRMSGIELLKRLKEIDPGIIVVMLTAYASVDNAVEAMKEGAYDYVSKPFQVDELKLVIRNALDKRSLERENVLLKRELESHFGFGEIVGTSPKMQKIYDMILRVAKTNTNILITGESGTGKELVARAIHRESKRSAGAFVPVNCGAIPENLLESELFGHEKGAFTGAVRTKKGLFEAAEGGSIFLDEVTELALNLQVKLLRVIQERRFKRVGGTEEMDADVRLISATNRDIEKEVKAERFRQDLFFRINVIPIALPPLRERKEEIPLLANHFIAKYSKAIGKEIDGIEAEALELLNKHDFPGNVRELENMMERAVALETGKTISFDTIRADLTDEKLSVSGIKAGGDGFDTEETGKIDFQDVVAGTEKRLIVEAMNRAGGVKTKAAEILNISLRSLRYLLDKYGIG